MLTWPSATHPLAAMPGGRDSTIVKLEFQSSAYISPPQVFSVLKEKGISVKQIEMLQELSARNTYDLKFSSNGDRLEGVSRLKGIQGLTVTPYDRSVVVTVLYLPFEVEQNLVVRVLGQYGTVSDSMWSTYGEGELKGILNGKRKFRMVLKRDIPSFLFIGGAKAHIRYFMQPRTCFKCGQEGHEAKWCPNRRCGKCWQLGHDKADCPNEVKCNLCGEDGHVSGACPTSYSARVSADVEEAPEPSQPGPEPMAEDPQSDSPEELDKVAHQVEQEFLASKQCDKGTVSSGADSSPPVSSEEAGVATVVEDLQLSSESESGTAMSDAGESVPEPPPREPPRGDSWFDSIGGESDSNLKRSASGVVSDQDVRPSETPTPSPQNKRHRLLQMFSSSNV